MAMALRCITNILSVLLLLSSAILSAADREGDRQSLEACRSKVLGLKTGTVIKVELKNEDGGRVYEFDVRDETNRDWDLECRVETAEIIEIEEEVFGIHDERFLKYMKVGLEEAKRIALRRYPGEIIEIEYELEANGIAVYEFDISTDDGKVMKIEIDAASGAIHEENRELWQTGYE